MAKSNHACDSQNILVNRTLRRIKEPMRTRVQFYLDKIRDRKPAGEVLTRDDVDRSIGRAYQDMLEDQAVKFDRAEVLAAIEAVQDGTKTIGLQEVVDALPG